MLLVHSLTFFIFFLKSLKVTQFLVESENCKVDFEKKKKKKEKGKRKKRNHQYCLSTSILSHII